jgi:hypothetical protein
LQIYNIPFKSEMEGRYWVITLDALPPSCKQVLMVQLKWTTVDITYVKKEGGRRSGGGGSGGGRVEEDGSEEIRGETSSGESSIMTPSAIQLPVDVPDDVDE